MRGWGTQSAYLVVKREMRGRESHHKSRHQPSCRQTSPIRSMACTARASLRAVAMRDSPVEALLELIVIPRQPTIRRAPAMTQYCLYERIAEPAIRIVRNGAVAHLHPGARRARRESRVTHQVIRSGKALDWIRFDDNGQGVVGSDARDRAKQTLGGISAPMLLISRSSVRIMRSRPSALHSWECRRRCRCVTSNGHATVRTQARPVRVSKRPRAKRKPTECSSACMREAACVRSRIKCAR
jgi:hypothetical protein